ncbi:ABC transporter ATP-binding protein [Luteolibacter ambystomatis]|uniref:ABC transporter ATP-binding protein n=1 Tax=Luteolibacter ambystomatis TaxID=2824561 RepID=A0A975PF61_9BACT|nr:ABC transporter ATP-binding protein [Luteolibacter ambystomatis]QUE51715.1 ABC transporter ATP-binding protein [Luteolibacter ambystomatis]
MNTLLEFHEVSCRYSRAWALDNASFRVPSGSITALLGPNGAGKSTALKIALNLIRPYSGHVTVLGTDSRNMNPKTLQRIGYVADGMDLPLWMTIDQFLGWCRPLYPQWDTEFERTLRKQFELPGDRKLKHLSRGQRMKAALASVLAYRPELLILDEPFSGLDPLVRDEFISGLLELSESEKFAVVVSSHDIEEVDRLADHIVLLNDGKVVLDENAEELLARHRLVEIMFPHYIESIPPLAPGWISAKSSGRLLRFVDSDHEITRFSENVRKIFPEIPQPDIHPLTLRELFVAQVSARKVGSDA